MYRFPHGPELVVWSLSVASFVLAQSLRPASFAFLWAPRRRNVLPDIVIIFVRTAVYFGPRTIRVFFFFYHIIIIIVHVVFTIDTRNNDGNNNDNNNNIRVWRTHARHVNPAFPETTEIRKPTSTQYSRVFYTGTNLFVSRYFGTQIKP